MMDANPMFLIPAIADGFTDPAHATVVSTCPPSDR